MAKKKSKKKTTYNPMSYIKASNPGTYTSQYTNQIQAARNNLMNFQYDPLQDASYQALAKVYAARGNQAAQDTLGDAAALNGGFGTSYAVSAAQQARNQYNQELMSMIPELEEKAYNRLSSNYGLLMDADTEAYNRYRDTVADYQWGKGYDTDVYQYKQAQKKSSSGGGSGGRRSSGGSSYTASTGSTTSNLADIYNKAKDEINNKKKKTTTTGGSGRMLAMTR